MRGTAMPRKRGTYIRHGYKAGPGRPPGSRNAVVSCTCGHCHTCWNREWTRRKRARGWQIEGRYGVEA